MLTITNYACLLGLGRWESSRAGHPDASSRQSAARFPAGHTLTGSGRQRQPPAASRQRPAVGRTQPPGREDRIHDHRDPLRSARSRSPDRTASMKRLLGYQTSTSTSTGTS